ALGKQVTAIGGYALDSNSNYKSGLYVKVMSGSTIVGQSTVSPPDGFYFVTVPAGGPYTVQLYNPTGALPGKAQSISTVASNQYVEADFLGLNPADPAITGFVFNSATQGMSGITLTLSDAHGKVVATTTTSSSGWYVFRFTQPGSYT